MLAAFSIKSAEIFVVKIDAVDIDIIQVEIRVVPVSGVLCGRLLHVEGGWSDDRHIRTMSVSQLLAVLTFGALAISVVSEAVGDRAWNTSPCTTWEIFRQLKARIARSTSSTSCCSTV